MKEIVVTLMSQRLDHNIRTVQTLLLQIFFFFYMAFLQTALFLFIFRHDMY